MKINFLPNVFFIYPVLTVLIILAFFVFDHHRQMSPVFTVPFFSGAANFTTGSKWKYAPEEVDIYKSKSSHEREDYKFRKLPESSLIEYQHYNIGYLYIILLAKKMFFWAGDVQAAKYIQLTVHILISLVVFSLMNQYINKYLFILLYSLNPLVIYFVTFPFLYFWQVVPAAVFFYAFLKNFKVNIYESITIGILLGVAFIIRPTVILISLYVMVLIYIKNPFIKSALVVCVCAVFIWIFNTRAENKSPWHTIYVGIGAYPNPYVSNLSDNAGFAVYKKYTGENINISTGGNFYDLTVFRQYDIFIQKEYIQIARQSPFMLLKNAIVNFFQSYSLGYFVDYPLWISYLSSLAGFIFFILLLLKKHYVWILAIGLSSLTFTPYFPPIQAYMFGAYILLVGAFIQLLNDFGIIRWLEERTKSIKVFNKFKIA